MPIEQSGLRYYNGKPMIYEPWSLPTGKYRLDAEQIYGFAGGKFDGKLHSGHAEYFNLMREILRGVTRQQFPGLPEGEIDQRVNLMIGVVRPVHITNTGRLTILPHWLRLQQVLDQPPVSGAYTASTSVAYDLDLYFQGNMSPRIVVFESSTTTDINAPWREEGRQKLRAKNVTMVMLPRLTPASTTDNLKAFFLGSNLRDEFRMTYNLWEEPSTVAERDFSLFYAKDLCLTPDSATVSMARQIAHEAREGGRKNLRALDLGAGSGVFLSTLLLNTNRDTFSNVRSVDNNQIALGISDFNTTRAALFAEKDLSILEFSQSSWFDEVHDTYDIIYANPPYLPATVGLGDEFKENPRDAIYANSSLENYGEIINQLPNHIHTGSTVILRVPRDERKVRPIKALITNTFNMEKVTMEDVFFGNRKGTFHYGDGRFIILKFN